MRPSTTPPRSRPRRRCRATSCRPAAWRSRRKRWGSAGEAHSGDRVVMTLRLIFMGTPDFAVPTLKAIVERGHEVVAVYTRAPKPAGRRGLELTPSPVERAARRLDLPVLTPVTLREAEVQATFEAHEAQAALVV